MSATHESGIRTARQLLLRGQLDDAARVVRDLMQRSSSEELLLLAIEIEEARGDFDKALDLSSESLARYGENAALLLRRAHLLVHAWRRAEAIATARRAAAISPPDARLLTDIARFHLQGNAPLDAKPLLARACELAPRDPAVLYEAAMCHHYYDEPEAAEALLARVLALAPGNGFALHSRSQLRTQTTATNHVQEIRAALARPTMPVREAVAAWFALAKELEDLGEFRESFEALLAGNRLKRSTLRYDVRDDARAMRNMRETFDATTLAHIEAGDPSIGPIFIVGMPRTGTTLVERILGSHSDVTSVGETVDFPIAMTQEAQRVYRELGLRDANLFKASTLIDFRRLGSRYLAAARDTTDRPYTVDKLPFNFQYCGLIHKALPNARILHLRRDPLDTCYAVFKTLFEKAYHFSYQLDELAEYYVAYRALMDHWHAVIPGAILDVRYEELVAEPERQSRAVLEWCGLPWQDRVLDFHRSAEVSRTASAAQVRRPIYTSSVQRWRKVATQMQPVLRRLAEAGLVDADGRDLAPAKT